MFKFLDKKDEKKSMKTSLHPIILIFALSLISCGKTAIDSPTYQDTAFLTSKASLYFQSSKKVVVEVYYEPGAEPFTGSTASGMPFRNCLLS